MVRYTKAGNVKVTLTVVQARSLKGLLNNSGTAANSSSFPHYEQSDETAMAIPLWRALEAIGIKRG